MAAIRSTKPKGRPDFPVKKEYVQLRNDQAYANAAYIPNGEGFVAIWTQAAQTFRAANPPEIMRYGKGARQVMDLFRPKGPPRGLFVFVHGGYWHLFDKDSWSHLAGGMLAHGWAVAVPSYTLCPENRIAGITDEVEAAISVAADLVAGPIRLSGHSAGGHLVARMACDDRNPAWRTRLRLVVPISALADLEPLMDTSMNADLRLDNAEAASESPINHRPTAPIHVWVGGDERPAFIDQSQWLANAWGAELTIEPGKHHFNVIESLARPDGALTRAVLG